MNLKLFLTATTESLPATVTMSAHNTTPGHMFSNLDLMVFITSNPLGELLIEKAVFSPMKFAVPSKRTDASPLLHNITQTCYLSDAKYSYHLYIIFYIHYKENVKVTINFTKKKKKKNLQYDSDKIYD